MESEVVIVIPPSARVAELEKELAVKNRQLKEIFYMLKSISKITLLYLKKVTPKENNDGTRL